MNTCLRQVRLESPERYCFRAIARTLATLLASRLGIRPETVRIQGYGGVIPSISPGGPQMA